VITHHSPTSPKLKVSETDDKTSDSSPERKEIISNYFYDSNAINLPKLKLFIINDSSTNTFELDYQFLNELLHCENISFLCLKTIFKIQAPII